MAPFQIVLYMVGILSFLRDIALEGSDNTKKATKYVAFLTELLNNKLYAKMM